MGQSLLIMTPDRQSRRIPLEGESLSLGRAHSNDLSFPEDASLSRRHFRLLRDEGGWWAEDLGSKNGTLLNDARITSKQLLSHGDRISVGQLTITIVDSDADSQDGVVFVPEEGPEIHPQATVMTSLEGLLSGEVTSPFTGAPRPQPRPGNQGVEFDSPEIQVLIRAGRLLADKMPLEQLFPLILDLSINSVGAERGVLMTLEGDSLVTRAVHGDGFRISTMVRDRVLKEKTSILVRDLQQDEAFKAQVSIFEQRIHTMMAVPLQTENRVIGLIYVDSRSFVREFKPDDLNLLTVLANVAAIRIEHQRYAELERREQIRTRDLDQAAEIQRMILPGDAPQIDGLDLAGHNQPCRTVGGDYYDFINCTDGRLAVVLGDVAGKGMAAALLMSNLQATVRLLGEDPGDLAKLMSRLDHNVAANCPSNRFITFFFGLIDPNTKDLVYCNAGHNPPLVIRSDGQIDHLKAEGTVLGILPQLGYHERTQTFDNGDLIAIFSDGVTESENSAGEEYGEQRLADLIVANRDEPAATIIDRVNQALVDWTSSAPAADDITLVVVRRTG
jgi:serine phosphatase RsbU (regulator of sigma subunit)